MKQFGLLVILFTSTMMGLAQPVSTPEESKVVDKIVGVVANEILLYSEVENQFINYARSGAAVGPNARCRVMEEMLVQKLMVHQAAVDSVIVDEGQINQELERRIQYFVAQIGSVDALEEYYGKSVNQIREEFYAVVKEQLTVQQMQQEVTGSVTVNPKEVQQFYKQIPEDSLPYISAQVEMAQIVIEPEISEEEKQRTREQLEELRKRVLAGENFGTLAYLYSQDPGSAKKKGELGYMTRGALVPEFAGAAFSLQPGAVSEIVETEYGFHIIQMIDRRGQEANVRHILLVPEVYPADLQLARTQLDSLRNVLMTNDTIEFGDLAKKYSDDEDTKQNGGVMMNPSSGSSRFELDQLNNYDPSLFYVIEKLEVGEISDPVLFQKQDGSKAYRLVQLTNLTEPHELNLTDDWQSIQGAATQEKSQKVMDEYIKDRLKVTYIKLDDELKSCDFHYNWNK